MDQKNKQKEEENQKEIRTEILPENKLRDEVKVSEEVINIDQKNKQKEEEEKKELRIEILAGNISILSGSISSFESIINMGKKEEYIDLKN